MKLYVFWQKGRSIEMPLPLKIVQEKILWPESPIHGISNGFPENIFLFS
jgi:hypothetical protein